MAERPLTMKTHEYRKIVKPLLERRRRARINGCLGELKDFIVETMKHDHVQASKLEKADILELTVQYLRAIRRQPNGIDVKVASGEFDRFRAGFAECVHEVCTFVTGTPISHPAIRVRLLTHLSKCVSQLEQINPVTQSIPPFSPEPKEVRIPTPSSVIMFTSSAERNGPPHHTSMSEPSRTSVSPTTSRDDCPATSKACHELVPVLPTRCQEPISTASEPTMQMERSHVTLVVDQYESSLWRPW